MKMCIEDRYILALELGVADADMDEFLEGFENDEDDEEGAEE